MRTLCIILSADGRKNVRKVEIFQNFVDFSKKEIQKIKVCACLMHQKMLDKKKITLDILCWEV
jgi:hypothetical protein